MTHHWALEPAQRYLRRYGRRNGSSTENCVETLTGEELPKPDFTEVRGTKGIKEAAYNVAGMEVKIAVASGLGNARELLNKVKSGEATITSSKSWDAQAAV